MPARMETSDTTSQPYERPRKVLTVPATLVDAKEPGQPRHVILEKLQVLRHGGSQRASDLDIRPASVHFAGFLLNRVHQTKIVVHNCSPDQMHHVSLLGLEAAIAGSHSPFSAHLSKKASKMAPGGQETIIVEFTAPQHRYYADFLLIHSSAGDFRVALHAYPAIPDLSFPSRVDFGGVPIGTRGLREVHIQNTSDVSFEFALERMQDDPCFAVSPSSGVLRSATTTTISIVFQPQRLASYSGTVMFSCSQFNFAPLKCVLSGHGSSVEAAVAPAPGVDQPSGTDSERLATLPRAPRAATSSATSASQAAAVGNAKRKLLGTSQNLQAHGTVAQVLSSRAPRARGSPSARPRDGAGSASLSASLTMNGPSVGLGAKEAFEKELRDSEEAEKRKQVKWFSYVGQEPVGPADVEQAMEERQRSSENEISSRREASLGRAASTFSSERPALVPQELTLLRESSGNCAFEPFGADRTISRYRAALPLADHAKELIVKTRVLRRLRCIREFLAKSEASNSGGELASLLPGKMDFSAVTCAGSSISLETPAAEDQMCDESRIEDRPLLWPEVFHDVPQVSRLESDSAGYAKESYLAFDGLHAPETARPFAVGSVEEVPVVAAVKDSHVLDASCGVFDPATFAAVEVSAAPSDDVVHNPPVSLAETDPSFLFSVPLSQFRFGAAEDPPLISEPFLNTAFSVQDYHFLGERCPLARDVDDDPVLNSHRSSADGDICAQMIAGSVADISQQDLAAVQDDTLRQILPSPSIADVIKEFRMESLFPSLVAAGSGLSPGSGGSSILGGGDGSSNKVSVSDTVSMKCAFQLAEDAVERESVLKSSSSTTGEWQRFLVQFRSAVDLRSK